MSSVLGQPAPALELAIIGTHESSDIVFSGTEVISPEVVRIIGDVWSRSRGRQRIYEVIEVA
jgi:hypothetical protein